MMSIMGNLRNIEDKKKKNKSYLVKLFILEMGWYVSFFFGMEKS
jgi:hypothetical protein